MNDSHNLVDVIRILLKWKKQILLFVTVAAISSVIVALILPEYYRSHSLFYPTNPSITDRQTLFSTEASNQFIDYFGTKNDVNRLMTFANSSAIIDFVINYYNLYDHYEVDTTDKDWRYKVKREFNSNYSVLKTEFSAIEVSLLDQDPHLAAEIVNMIVSKIDELNKKIIIDNKFKILKIFEGQLKEKQLEVNKLTDTLAYLQSAHNIKETVISDGQGIAVTGNDPNIVETYKVLALRHKNSIEDLNLISSLHDQYDASAKETVSSLYILEIAYPALRKAKPIRWLVCVTATIIALFTALFGALLLEKVSYIKEELNASQ